MRYDKSATTVEDQAKKLIARGLIVSDQEKLERYLFSIGYYRLSAYWLPFELPSNGGQTRSKKFKEDTSLEIILNTYVCDRKLRLLVMEAIERIEIVVRSRWTNRFTLKHGPHGHLECENFNQPWDHMGRLYRINKSTTTSNEVFVDHYKKKYTSPHLPPLWAASELLSLGELSKLYSTTKDNQIKMGVARDIGLPTMETADSALHTLTYIRNICAHHARLWNRRLVIKPRLIKKLRDSFAVDVNGEITNYLYNVLVLILIIISSQSPDSSYKSRLIALLEEFGDERLHYMGFPRNWRERPIWGN